MHRDPRAPRPTSHRATARHAWRLAVGLALLLAPSWASAAPSTLAVEGVLTAANGTPAADGKYDLTFAVYASASAKTAVWSEGPVEVAVFAGRFSTALGSKSPLDAKALGALATPTLGVRVGKDPELPRRPLRATAYALHAQQADALACTGCLQGTQLASGSVAASKVAFNYAASTTKGGAASDLACTGCVSSKELKFDGDIDLSGNSLKAKNGTFTGDLVAATVTATSFVGDGSKLTGLALPSGSCKSGLVVIGIAQDGSLQCGAALTGDALPKDGLSGVSNGLLTNQFTEQLGAGGLPVIIPDNTGSEALAKVVVPDLGVAQALDVRVKLSNTNLAAVRAVVLPPDDKKVGVTLCDPCGAKDAKGLDTLFPAKTKPKSGDLGKWVGANPKGEWLLKVLDSSFCVPQAPGNGALCDTSKKTDGQILAFDVVVKVLSNQKAAATGLLQLALMTKPPVGCGPSHKGALFYDTSVGGIRYCDGKDWRLLADTCGNGILEPSEQCDDGNNVGGDGCGATCLSGLGGSEGDAGRSCKDIKDAKSTAGNGTYWLDLDGPGAGKPAQYVCDMAGGGWTRVYAESGALSAGWSSGTLTTATIGGKKSLVHGPYGAGAGTTKTIGLGGLPHTQVRVSGRYFAIDSWDGEAGQVIIDGKTVFSRTKVYSSTGGAGWTSTSFSPAPWSGSSVDGYWDLWTHASATAHTANAAKVQLKSSLDQDKSDESWAADNVALWAR